MPKARSAAAASRGHGGGSQGAQQGRRAADVFLLLLALRIANGLLVRTFFQPDEFFQSLEPAWGIAFGRDSGAWITWVCIPPPRKGRNREKRDRMEKKGRCGRCGWLTIWGVL